MLEVNNLSVQMQNQCLLEDINFDLCRGETLCIIGESGSGKTTLLRSLLGLIPLSQGSVSLNGHVYQSPESSQIGLPSTQMVMQDPIAALNPRKKVKISIAESLYRSSLKAAEIAHAIKQALNDVELPDGLENRYPSQISLGQAQRVCIARAIVAKPDILFFDEPLSALDAIIQKQIAQVLERIKKQNELSYIFITHDLGFARHYADKILLLNRGKVAEYQGVGLFFERPESAYGQELLEAAYILGSLPHKKTKEIQAA
ncbi:dipeptide/oligopeptide/nickel ABC transporter ATP-binding protein [uncultured Kiloniella sp.]|uniref:ABC transporter ATP-binding protein n=1 Tax=uncultured Kiloniella sp. TaxID=1133091 RepID=UPI002626B0B2|nr:dipeptide/oligopeptide/nickel ABC transporter ATP-binding protein [uncultured Kiloniella sp.]